MTDDICQCAKCGRMHKRLGSPPPSVMEQIARDMREGAFPHKSEKTLQEEKAAMNTSADELLYLADQEQHELERIRGHDVHYGDVRACKVKEWALREMAARLS